MLISQAAFDLIVQEETGGRSYYERTEVHPDWPGGASGVTIGCGFDCGYASAQDIVQAWGDILPASMVSEIQTVAGIRGFPARSHAADLRGIVSVPWDSALKVFFKNDVPHWTATVLQALPNAKFLSGNSLGALVSLAFNRGASFALPGDRYLEMRNIRTHMMTQNYKAIPAEFRAMQRLWPHNPDLRNRREHEAALFERGLS